MFIYFVNTHYWHQRAFPSSCFSSSPHRASSSPHPEDTHTQSHGYDKHFNFPNVQWNCVKKRSAKEEVTPVTHLIAEDLDLASSSVYELVGPGAEVVGVNLQVEREAFHSLLRGEVCAQGVNANVHLEDKNRRPFQYIMHR